MCTEDWLRAVKVEELLDEISKTTLFSSLMRSGRE
jgi:hypothetical protein